MSGADKFVDSLSQGVRPQDIPRSLFTPGVFKGNSKAPVREKELPQDLPEMDPELLSLWESEKNDNI